jgi:hypothetical protein
MPAADLGHSLWLPFLSGSNSSQALSTSACRERLGCAAVPDVIPDFYIGFLGKNFTINVPENVHLEDKTIPANSFCFINQNALCFGPNQSE